MRLPGVRRPKPCKQNKWGPGPAPTLRNYWQDCWRESKDRAKIVTVFSDYERPPYAAQKRPRP